MQIGALEIDSVEYASQANAILGIRDSGKTYTATYIAERLLGEHIPFVAFDPIGVWRYLKVGVSGPGYQVVVAGENADLPLTPDSAPNIVRAAMRENIPLVLDLYSMSLSKADWKRIVEESIRLLLYENKEYGLRHIFIEEAAEFIPQRVGPDQGRVYAEIEKLARMGGNASLGYTLINQRAEEVNKAVLELCDCLILHRQKGRHSLTALGKWLDVADVGASKEIVKSLPSLLQGHCWVWLQGSYEPHKIVIPEKATAHPDRRHPLKATSVITADVSGFVARLKTSLEAQQRSAPHSPKRKETERSADPKLREENSRLALENEQLRKEIAALKAQNASLNSRLSAAQAYLKPQYEALKPLFSEQNGVTIVPLTDESHWNLWLDKFGGKQRDMLELLIAKKRLTKQQLQLLTGLSRESVRIYLNKFASAGLVKRDGDEVVLQEP